MIHAVIVVIVIVIVISNSNSNKGHYVYNLLLNYLATTIKTIYPYVSKIIKHGKILTGGSILFIITITLTD